jgi:histone-lysine N-methyltransferase SETMAR
MCQQILSDELNMRHIAAKFVPRLLSNDQKEHCVAICPELKEQIENDPVFISTIITGDESWVYGYDPETKQQSSQWKMPNSLRPKKS